MEQVFYSNHTIRYTNGKFESNDFVGRKLILNSIDDENYSFLIYNFYTIPFELLLDNRKAKVIKKDKDYLELKVYKIGSYGIPINDMVLKIKFVNHEIDTVEHIDIISKSSQIYKKRVTYGYDLIFEILKLQDVVPPNLKEQYLKSLRDNYHDFFRNIRSIKSCYNTVELSVCGSYFLTIARCPRIVWETELYYNTLLIGFPILYQSYNKGGGFSAIVKLIGFVSNHSYAFNKIIGIKLKSNNQYSDLMPFKNFSEEERAKRIVLMMESWCIYLEREKDLIAPLKDVIAKNKIIFSNSTLEPYNIHNSLDTIKLLYKLLNESIG